MRMDGHTHTHTRYTTTDPTASLHITNLPRPPKHTYTPITAYGASKLCNLLFAFEFHRRYSSDGVSCNSVHPGNLLATNLMWNAGIMYRLSTILARPFTKSLVCVCVCVCVIYLSSFLLASLPYSFLPPSLSFFQEQAVATILYVAAHPSLANISGLYWYECHPVEPSHDALDSELAEGLWNFSQKLISDKIAGTSDVSSSSSDM